MVTQEVLVGGVGDVLPFDANKPHLYTGSALPPEERKEVICLVSEVSPSIHRLAITLDDLKLDLEANPSKSFANVIIVVSAHRRADWLWWSINYHRFEGCVPALYIGAGAVIPHWRTLEFAFIVVAADLKTLRWFVPCTSVVLFVDQRNSSQPLGFSYANWLLEPLQPLKDNLDTVVYQLFGRDVLKYSQYGEAIALAADDFRATYAKKPLIMIVGAGQGGIVETLISHDVEYSQLIIVEKNPSCFQELEIKLKTWGNVKLHLRDAKDIDLRADIIILEMLGSMGDNELYPEISARFSGKIIVPEQYTTKIYPIQTSVRIPEFRPYISFLTKYFSLAKAQNVWSFSNLASTFERVATLTFECQEKGVLNAFIATFDATLYGHINNHNCHATGGPNYCSSWFPMVFPVKSIEVYPGQQVEVEISRKIAPGRVWYEWVVDGFCHNSGGENYFMDNTFTEM